MNTSLTATAAVELTKPPHQDALPGTQPTHIRKEGRAKRAPRRWRRRQARPDPWRSSILAALRASGCFICREAKEGLNRYYFWFLEEQYSNPTTVERLQSAHGFCLRHTRHLLERGPRDRLAVVGQSLLRSCGDKLRTVRDAAAAGRPGAARGEQAAAWRFVPSVECPACEQERAQVTLYADVIVRCLADADVRRAFHASEGLCLPHFLLAAWRAPWDILQYLAAEQLRRLEQTRANLSATHAVEDNDTEAGAIRKVLAWLYGPDLDAPVRPFQVAGRRPGMCGADRTPRKIVPSASWSPVFEETCRLLEQPGCSICREVALGREEYLAWLEEEIRSFTGIGYRWSEVEDLCGEHAWLFADRAATDVLAIACGGLVDRMVEGLRWLFGEIREPIPPSLAGRIQALPSRWREFCKPIGPSQRRPRRLHRIRWTLRTLWQTPQDFLDRKRMRALRWNNCPLCSHLGTVAGRTADRLIAVLEDAEGRRAFDRSYAVCLRHAPLLLNGAADPEIRRTVAAVLLARVEVDHWEVEEFLRKSSWSQRHEPKAAEQDACLRACMRVSGTALERRHGF